MRNLSSLKNNIGWSTVRKIVVIESDDWGSFRYKNKYYRDKFMSKGDKFKCLMSYQDCFESAYDLQNLFNTLNLVEDKNEIPAKFTFLMNPSNPDFNRIKADNFQNFYNETFLETLDNRADGKEIFNSYNEALKCKLIEIGFHGREHLNVNEWMMDLQNNDEIAHMGFENKTWGFSRYYLENYTRSYRSTYEIASYKELDTLKANISEGIDLINKTFHQNTTYFLPPDGPYHLSLNQTLADNGIKYIGLSKLHTNPLEPKWYQKKLFWPGKKTKEGLIVITRNVKFEPASPKNPEVVNKALGEIQNAFKHKKPAVISSHRANYVSGLDAKLAERSLLKLEELLKGILKKWPEVEFMTSTQLGEIMSTK